MRRRDEDRDNGRSLSADEAGMEFILVALAVAYLVVADFLGSIAQALGSAGM